MENTAKLVTLQLTVDEINVVLAGLGELPAKASMVVIDKVRRQAVEQIQQDQVADKPN